MGSNKYVPSSWRCSQRGTMGTPSLVNFDIFLLHGVAASLRALPMSQSSAPPPSVAPGPDFYFDLYEETEVCQFAILRTRPPEEAVLYGGAWGRSCTSLPGGPSKGLSFRPSKTDRRLKSPTNVKKNMMFLHRSKRPKNIESMAKGRLRCDILIELTSF